MVPLPSRTDDVSLAALARLSAAAALLAGAGELALRLLARQFLPDPVFIYPAAAWLGPLSAGLIFTPVIVAAWFVGRLHAPGTAWRSAVAVATFLALFDLAMLVPRLHPLALAVLAAGGASVVVRLSRRWPSPFARSLNLVALASALLCLGGGLLAARTPRSAPSTEGQAQAGAPSVLFLILDTVRADELSAYGYGRPTSPAMAALAAEGVRFDLAVATAPWTLPTHASLFTGLFQRDLSVGWSTPLDTVPRTLAELFAKAGYATGGFIANLRYVSREHGLDRGFQAYRDYAPIPSQLVGTTMTGRRVLALYNTVFGRYIHPGRKDARRVIDEFLAWQGGLGGRPYFAFLNLYDAHDPYAPAAPYDLMFMEREPPTREVEMAPEHAPEEVQGLRDAYDGAIASMDAELGRLFAELQRRGGWERTLVVLTGDHGEELGEDGHLGHGNDLHFPALHVPLIIRWPDGGVPAGATVPEPVSLADVPATILDVARLGAGGSLPGHSLAGRWQGSGGDSVATPILSELYWAPNQPEWYPIAGGDMHSLVRGRWHFIAGADGREELFDIVADPLAQHNLVADSRFATTVQEMRSALATLPMARRNGR